MLSVNYENINNVMTQILKLSCASFSYVNISYVLADEGHMTRRKRESQASCTRLDVFLN